MSNTNNVCLNCGGKVRNTSVKQICFACNQLDLDYPLPEGPMQDVDNRDNDCPEYHESIFESCVGDMALRVVNTPAFEVLKTIYPKRDINEEAFEMCVIMVTVQAKVPEGLVWDVINEELSYLNEHTDTSTVPDCSTCNGRTCDICSILS